MPEITQNKLLTLVTYGNFQAYYFRRKKNREGQREKGLGRKKEERKKRIKKKEKRTQPVIQTHRNSGQAYVIEKMFMYFFHQKLTCFPGSQGTFLLYHKT